MTSIITFLAEIFNKGASYGSVNCHRSALSLLLGNNIGSDDLIKRLLKGIYRQNPPKPKYCSTWDPQIVLNLISSWHPNSSLSLEKITKKVSILLALCTGQRVQTLSLIKISNIIQSFAGVKISITDAIKTSAAGREQPILNLPYFNENVKICPATAIQDYLTATAGLRPPSTDSLLLTFKKPHSKASSQTISRWLRQVLAESGVDVKMFGAHSTRHASTSAAASAGVDINTIHKTAGWTSTSLTFARFYNRPLNTDGAFAHSILCPAVNQNNSHDFVPT